MTPKDNPEEDDYWDNRIRQERLRLEAAEELYEYRQLMARYPDDDDEMNDIRPFWGQGDV